ncbi:DNA methyltransferase [Actinotignum sp. GS-2025c]|uniref:DNA methyltransferase n=1 Tax=Actinotignum sp. GS-2025c TaxID=3427276 RepID=UPI003F45939B
MLTHKQLDTLYTHRHKIDAIYIDPPYNTGAKDWKYNNDYVVSDDAYRHSKWLAMMERRLLVARELLNPADSVLICTIDEKEYLRLGLLLEQSFPEAHIQMVSIVINPNGVARDTELARVDEYAFFVFLGESRPALLEDPLLTRNAEEEKIEWLLPGVASPNARYVGSGYSGGARTLPDLIPPDVFIQYMLIPSLEE